MSHILTALLSRPSRNYEEKSPLVSLPDSLLSEVLFRFLQFSEVAVFDTAVTSRSLRPLYIAQLLLEHSDTVEKKLTTETDALQLVWLLRRGLLVRRISCYPDIPERLVMDLAQASLESLSLFTCGFITDLAVFHIAEECSKLIYLDLSDCWQVTDASLVTLHRFLPVLEWLSVSGCRAVTDISVSSFSACSRLSHLDLSYCATVSDYGIASLANGCPALSSINVSHLLRISDESLIALFKRSLHRVVINGCDGVGSESLIALCNSNLQHLSCAVCPKAISDEVVDRMICSKLKYLDFSGAHRLSPVFVKRLCTLSKHLRHVDLQQCDVTDEAVTSLALLCSTLTHLNLSYSKSDISDVALKFLANMCGGLMFLAISGSQIGDECLASFSSCCSDLRILHVACCLCLSEFCFSNLLFPKVVELSVSHCRFNDDAINNLIRSCPKVSILYASHLPNVTDESISAVMSSYCRNIEHLDFSYNNRISTSWVRTIGTLDFPRLKSINLLACRNIDIIEIQRSKVANLIQI
jgi:hypothetical protein